MNVPKRLALWALLVFAAPGLSRAADPVALSIGANFTASTYGLNVASIPSDANGAVGPRHFVELINGSFTCYNKTNGRSVKRTSDLQFWSSAGLIISPDAVTTDPRVIYDPVSQRWFATMVDLNASAPDPAALANNFLLAVSQTSDPTGVWKGFQFSSDPDTGFFADFPTLGVDGAGVYISGDMYSDSITPVGPGLVSIPKADLLQNPPSIDRRTWFGVMDYVDRGEVLQPATCFDGSVTGQILSLTDIGSVSDPLSNVVAFAVLNPGSSNATLGASTEIPTFSWLVPDNAELGGPLLTMHQPDGTSALMANDARFSGRVVAVNGSLYAVHTTDFGGHLAIRWYRVRASDHHLMESGTLSDPNLDYAFPSIAGNGLGVVVIGFNASGASMTVSSCAIAGQTINGVTTFGSRLLLQAGATSYHGDDEILAELLGDPILSRWGDYSATTVDPVDPNRFWTIQMFPSDAANPDYWSTRVTELITAPVNSNVTLALQKSGGNVVVSWSLAATGFALQSATNLTSSTFWTSVSQTPQTNGLNLAVTLPISGRTFFRLKK